MKILLPIFLSSFLCMVPTSAATVTALGAIVSTYVEGNSPEVSLIEDTDYLMDALTPDPFLSAQFIDLKGNGKDGFITAELSALNYQEDHAGDGTFLITSSGVTSTHIGAITDINVRQDNTIQVSALSEHVIDFSLAAGETRLANLDLAHSFVIDSGNQDSEVSLTWQLVGPNGEVTDLSGSFSQILSGANIQLASTSQSTTLTEAGNYTLTVSVALPDQPT
jgi:hypothetical protein